MHSHPLHRSSAAHLVNEPAGPRETMAAIATVLVSVVLFAFAVPYARVALAPFPAFVPIYVTALVIFDLITAVLLFGQYRALGSPGLLVLGGAYLFTATTTAAYSLIFPGLLAPTGLLGSGPQTSSAMYMLWHAGFPLVVIAYAQVKHRAPHGPEWVEQGLAHRGIVATVLTVLAVVAVFTWFATAGHRFLPVFLDGNRTTVIGKIFLSGIWMLSLAALVMLWRRKPHSELDAWLLVVMCVWLLDIALAAVLNTGRYDLGWYMGRIYGLLGAGYLLIVLLSESARHHARLRQVTAALESANDTLWRFSMQDGLTELANRRAFDLHLAEQVALATRHQRPLALVLVDADHFKAYNDEYGHQLGDECLQALAKALQDCGKRPSDMAARYGGEEFALVLPETDREGAQHIAASLQSAVAGLAIPHRKSPTAPHVTMSIGIATLRPGQVTTPQRMIDVADKALYEAKKSGRNRIVLEEDTLGPA